MRIAPVFVALVVAGPVLAEPSAEDWAGFEACVAESYAAQSDNPMAAMGVPILCGDRHIPIPQTCSMIARMTSPKACHEKDHAFWKAAFEAVLPEGGMEAIPPASMFASGMKRCAEQAEEGIARVACETELYWREVMLDRAGPVIRQVRGE